MPTDYETHIATHLPQRKRRVASRSNLQPVALRAHYVEAERSIHSGRERRDIHNLFTERSGQAEFVRITVLQFDDGIRDRRAIRIAHDGAPQRLRPMR